MMVLNDRLKRSHQTRLKDVLNASKITQNAVPGQRLRLCLEVLNVVHFAVDDRPEATVLVVVLEVCLADEGHLLVVLGALTCKERACHSRATLVTFKHTLLHRSYTNTHILQIVYNTKEPSY